MRHISTNIDPKSKAGTVRMEAVDAEDMWHLYNLLAPGDILRAPTIRKVQQETSTGSSTSERVRLTVSLKVDSFQYDPTVVVMRVPGRVALENPHIRVGAFHTIEIEPHRAFSLSKDRWDSVYMDRMQLAFDPAVDADLGAIVMEEGLAHILMVSRSLTITRARIESNIPRKGKNALYNRDTAIEKFFDKVLRAAVQHLDMDKLKVLLIASPGYVKDGFYKYMGTEAARQDLRSIIDNKAKMVLCHASSGHKHAFHEVLTRPELQSRLAKTKAVSEVQALNDFHEMLGRDQDRAVYGPAHVNHAAEMGAIDKLLVTDTLFRAPDPEKRQKVVTLVENIKQSGATVNIFSTQHVTGEQLNLMSGIAAILRFPLPDLDDIEPEE